MRRIVAAVLLLLAAGPAAADEFFPAFYRVVEVAAEDTLNVRAGPGSTHEIVTELAHNAAFIEVVARDPGSGWLLLNTPDDWSGYAAPRFLARMDDRSMDTLPLPLNCGGTEPFWGITLGAHGSAIYSDPETPERWLAVEWHDTAASRMGNEFGVILAGTDEDVHAVINRQICSDGMSEFWFGLKIDAIVRSSGMTSMMTGCCRLTH